MRVSYTEKRLIRSQNFMWKFSKNLSSTALKALSDSKVVKVKFANLDNFPFKTNVLMKAQISAKIRVKIEHLTNPDKPCLKPPLTKPQSLLVVLVPLVYAKEAWPWKRSRHSLPLNLESQPKYPCKIIYIFIQLLVWLIIILGFIQVKMRFIQELSQGVRPQFDTIKGR